MRVRKTVGQRIPAEMRRQHRGPEDLFHALRDPNVFTLL